MWPRLAIASFVGHSAGYRPILQHALVGPCGQPRHRDLIVARRRSSLVAFDVDPAPPREFRPERLVFSVRPHPLTLREGLASALAACERLCRANVRYRFLAKVGADDRVNGRFEETNMAKLRGLLVDQVCEATGGLLSWLRNQLDTPRTDLCEC